MATTHAFYTDVDLWPSETLYSRLHATKYLDPKRFTNPTHAFVVPAFEVIKVSGRAARSSSFSP